MSQDYIKQYKQAYQQDLYPNKYIPQLYQYVRQQLNTVNWPEVEQKFAVLTKNFEQYYNNNYNFFKQRLQRKAQDNYDRDLELIQMANEGLVQRGRPLVKEPQLKQISDDIVLTKIISNYVKNNNSYIKSFFTMPDFKVPENTYINKRYYSKILKHLAQGKTMQDYIKQQIGDEDPGQDDLVEYYAIDELIEIVYIISAIALPNLLNEVENILLQNNYVWHYFTFLNTNYPMVKAQLNQVPLNFNTFEQHANIFSIPNGERLLVNPRTSTFSTTVYNGWSKNQLLDAIFDSGLMQPCKYFKNSTSLDSIVTSYQNRDKPLYGLVRNYIDIDMSAKNPETGEYLIDDFSDIKDNYENILANPQNYPFTRYARNIYRRDDPKDIERLQFRLTHCLPWRSIGVDRDGHVRVNEFNHRDRLGAIYRRIYGTIYTINWLDFCKSGKIQIIDTRVLAYIIEFYFNPGYNVDDISYEQACQLITSQLPAIQQQMQRMDPKQWAEFIRSRYNQRIIQAPKRTLNLSPPTVASTKLRLMEE